VDHSRRRVPGSGSHFDRVGIKPEKVWVQTHVHHPILDNWEIGVRQSMRKSLVLGFGLVGGEAGVN